MQTHPPEDWLSLAEVRRAEAQRLFAAGRFREALALLNSAIQMAPGHAPLFELRAAVFERMGMQPQAEGDRREVERLGGTAAPPPAPEPPHGAPEAPEEPARAGGEPAPPGAGPQPGAAPAVGAGQVPGRRVEPASPPRRPAPAPEGRPERPRFGVLRAAGGAIVGLLVLAVAGSGVVLAVLSLVDREDVVPGIDREQPTTTAARTAAATPTGRAVQNVKGSPFDLDRVVKGWSARGIVARQVEPTGTFSGFAVSPSVLELTSGQDSARVAVFVYADAKAMSGDWTLVPESGPSPKSGRALPSRTAGWWNQNVAVILLSARTAVSDDARDAFLALAP